VLAFRAHECALIVIRLVRLDVSEQHGRPALATSRPRNRIRVGRGGLINRHALLPEEAGPRQLVTDTGTYANDRLSPYLGKVTQFGRSGSTGTGSGGFSRKRERTSSELSRTGSLIGQFRKGAKRVISAGYSDRRGGFRVAESPAFCRRRSAALKCRGRCRPGDR
jgi:hypothetical protein